MVTKGSKSGSEALRRPQTALSTQRHAGVAVRQRAARVGPRVVLPGQVPLPVRAFAAVVWPGTGRDVEFSALARAVRSPSGWLGVGFHGS